MPAKMRWRVIDLTNDFFNVLQMSVRSGHSSAWTRVLAWGARGQGFKSPCPDRTDSYGILKKSCQIVTRGQGFKSPCPDMIRSILENVIFYPAYVSLILFGYLLNKVKARFVTDGGNILRGYMEVSDGQGRVVHLSWKDFLVLRTNWRGRLRRYFTIGFRKGYVEEQAQKRKGECKRCGLCCCERMCPFVIENKGRWDCLLHPHKPLNCTIFPINQKDVREYGCRGFTFEGQGITVH